VQKSIKRAIEKSPQPYFHSGLRFLSDLELSKTTDENFEELSNKRTELLGVIDSNDLTAEEITDVKEYRSGKEKVKRFKNVQEFLEDLND